MSFAEAIARERDVAVPDEARACSAAMSKWIDANREPKPAKGRKARKMRGQAAEAKTSRKRKSESATEDAAKPGDARTDPQKATPLRIPYGNKEVAFKLGARYAKEGWYAPAGADLAVFRERGWL